MKLRFILAHAFVFVAVFALATTAYALSSYGEQAYAKEKQVIHLGNKAVKRLVYTSKKVPLNASAQTRLSYKSSNKSIVKVTKSGKLKLKRAGTAKIKITAAQTKRYKKAVKTVKVKVVRAKQVIKASSYHKTLRSKKFKVKVSLRGKAAVRFKSSASYIASVNEKTGKVKVGSYTGIATITIRASKTTRYRAAKKKIRVYVAKYPYAFDASKNKGTISLSSLVNAKTMKRVPVDETLQSCNELTPQGLCVTEEHILLSAYCYFHSNGKVKHNSILHVLDKQTKKPVKTLVLENVDYGNHVGGVAVDDKGNVWIAGSTSNTMLMILKSTFDAALSSSEESVAVDYDGIFSIGKRASFASYYNGILWVGSFDEVERTVLHAYSITEKDGKPSGLKHKYAYSVAQGANGVAFYKKGSTLYLCVSRQINGRNGYSELLFYKEKTSGSSRSVSLVGGVSLPCMVEEVDISDNSIVYISYESIARNFRLNEDGIGKPMEVTPYVTMGSIETLLNKALAFGPA